jgi:hypothetical protein
MDKGTVNLCPCVFKLKYMDIIEYEAHLISICDPACQLCTCAGDKNCFI